jgi:hypothetical protein
LHFSSVLAALAGLPGETVCSHGADAAPARRVEMPTVEALLTPRQVDVPRPTLRVVIRHVALNLLTANLIPAALFALCLMIDGLPLALGAALAWCYGAVLWRMSTGRRTSALLWLSVLGLTAKTAVALVSGSTFVYFLQPALSNAVAAVVFLFSLATARPVIARLAADFYPMDADLAARPRIKQLFWRLTLVWASILAVQAVVALWLLHSASMTSCAQVRSLLGPTAAIGGAAVTVLLAARVARIEGLLPGSALSSVGVA